MVPKISQYTALTNVVQLGCRQVLTTYTHFPETWAGMQLLGKSTSKQPRRCAYLPDQKFSVQSQVISSYAH